MSAPHHSLKHPSRRENSLGSHFDQLIISTNAASGAFGKYTSIPSLIHSFTMDISKLTIFIVLFVFSSHTATPGEFINHTILCSLQLSLISRLLTFLFFSLPFPFFPLTFPATCSSSSSSSFPCSSSSRLRLRLHLHSSHMSTGKDGKCAWWNGRRTTWPGALAEWLYY